LIIFPAAEIGVECTYDVRSRALQGVKLPYWMDRDPYAHDILPWLAKNPEIPPEKSEAVMCVTHQRMVKPDPWLRRQLEEQAAMDD
jgi:hypothetical protein